ncbi:MAG: Lon protease [Myxococcales bacterium]
MQHDPIAEADTETEPTEPLRTETADSGKPETSRRTRSLVSVDEGPPTNLFVFPLAVPVLFPGMAVPLPVTSERGQRIVDQVVNQSGFLGFVARIDLPDDDQPAADSRATELHDVGVVARVVDKLDLPDGTYAVLVQALSRFRITRWARKTPFLIAKVAYVEETNSDPETTEALAREIKSAIHQIIELIPEAKEHFDASLLGGLDPSRLADFVAAHVGLPPDERQRVLAASDVTERLRVVLELVMRELGVRQLGARIREEIRQQAEDHQKRWVLHEQLKAIKRELGDEGGDATSWPARIADAKMPPEAEARAKEELARLEGIPTESPEHNVLRTWLEWMCALPWSRTSDDLVDMDRARHILDDDHFGLDEVKERIEEILAVRKLRPGLKGPILCFVGPPGVGKTSLGKSIAKALGREVFRFSVGGMRDEAEIKGHRRTYVGAMPGKILQGLRRVGTANPVFVLDEIDKIAHDWRGDPASALLEVLDPAQNADFLDHYLDVRFDLSRVLFIATANVTETIPAALLDRMEVIRLSSYIEDEKVEIAARYLVPRQREENGLDSSQLQLPRPVLREIVRGWTREGGVRNLEREIAKVCRKSAAAVAKGSPRPARVTAQRLPELLGPSRFEAEQALRPRPGTAIGLAWTSHGGEILHIECAAMRGSGTVTLTGKLGDVMAESARIAVSWVRGHLDALGLDPDALKQQDLHVHFPAGAIPKDGPSAGVTIATALASLLLPTAPLRPGVAMTGELTLTGRVLPVGGIKEKVIAAKAAGLTTVILPAANEKDLAEVPPKARDGLTFVLARDATEVLNAAFEQSPLQKQKPKKKKDKR